jgi:mycothiol synthase
MADENSTLPALPPGFTARPAVREDADQLWPILAAIDVVLTGEANMTLNDFLGDWEGIDLATQTMVVFNPDGTPSGYADFDNRAHVAFFLYAYVYPSQWGTGIDEFLMAWGETCARELSAAAPEGARIVTRSFVNEKHADGIAVVEARGYRPVRVTYTMKIDLTEPPPAPVWPDGIAVRTFVPGNDDLVAYEANEEIFADMWQRPPGTLEQFLSKQRRPYFDPDLWFLAMDGNVIAGLTLADNIDGKGWIENVGVRRPWRRRGMALALLLHAFGALYARGVTHIGLSVDAESPTGAPRIYERAGMELDQSYRLYELELRPGFEIASQPAAE